MFVVKIDKNIATILKTEPITSGSSKTYLVKFCFSPEWDDLTKVAVFRSGETVIDVLLDDSNLCFIPWEVTVEPDIPIEFGVYGTRDGHVVLPTIWARTKKILEGVITEAESRPLSPSLYDQILSELGKKGESLSYDGVYLSLMSNEKALSTVEIIGEKGDGEGITDHRLLSGREAEDQHPISAITDLKEVLSSIPQPMEADELRKILMNGDD